MESPPGEPATGPSPDRRIVIALGIAGALGLGVLIAFLLGAGGEDPDVAPAASKGGLVVEVEQPDLKVDLNRELPCYVGGQLVGLTSHAQCAERNGVSSGQLDVGIGPEGELAYGEAGALFAPLPPEDLGLEPLRPPVAYQPPPSAAPREVVAACWRHDGGSWRQLADMGLNACVKTLFDGRCEEAGDALYGRWGTDTLRLVPGQVERSANNRNFDPLVRQGPGCSLAL